MILSRKAEYGIRPMLEIATLPLDTKTVIPDTAKCQDIPPIFLAKIIPGLAKAGLLRTYRGVSVVIVRGVSGKSLVHPSD